MLTTVVTKWWRFSKTPCSVQTPAQSDKIIIVSSYLNNIMVIDQSGRVEETNRTSIVALADKKFSFTIALSSKTKKELLQIFRKNGKPKTFPIVTFALMVFMTMLRSKTYPPELIIDIEYPGHENTIKNIILVFCKRYKKQPPQIYFANIGKNDPAHLAAWGTYTKKYKPNIVLKTEDFIGKIPKKKK